jgi:hypothetical protein
MKGSAEWMDQIVFQATSFKQQQLRSISLLISRDDGEKKQEEQNLLEKLFH